MIRIRGSGYTARERGSWKGQMITMVYDEQLAFEVPERES